MLSDNDIKKLTEVFATKEEINDRFNIIDRKFGQVDENFKDTNKHFEQVDQRLNEINERFELLPTIFPTREEVASKQDLEELKEDFSDLQISVDIHTKKVDDYLQEMIVMNHRIDRLEKKVGINYYT
jgi:predicted nuclease with TOPRIM domain